MTRLLDFLRRHAPQVSISLVITAVFALHTAGLLTLPLVDRLEYVAYDNRLRWAMPNDRDPRIVIVDVDERSLQAEGHWPWPRAKLARLVSALFDQYHVRVAGFDFVFAEQDESAALAVIDGYLQHHPEPVLRQAFAELRPQLDADAVFASSLRGRPVVLGYYFSHDANERRAVGALPEPLLPAEIVEALGIRTIAAAGYGANLPILQKAAAGGGFFDNTLSDTDGIFRRAPLFQSYDGDLYESLALAITRTYLGGSIEFDKHNEWLYIGDHAVPMDQDMAALVPFRGPAGSFDYVSATDVIQNRVANPQTLNGAVALIGTTAPGLFDLRNTPVQNVYPGVEIHANMISGVLDNRYLQRPGYTRAIDLLGVVAMGCVLAFALPALGAIAGTALSLGIGIAATAVNLLLWSTQQLVLPLAPALLLVLSLILFNTAWGFVVESSRKRELTRRFGQYVPRELVDEMSRDPRRYTLAGERRELTVLFSDVRGFTSISERLDPPELSRLMNELLTSMTRIIHQHRGTIDKYMGDAIMAFWGAPLDDRDHAAHAVAAALAMQEELARVRERFAARGWPEVRMGIGLNTGPMSVGNMGSEFRMAYTVLGDAVNLGSRLEGLTVQYGVGIVVSESTVAAAPGFTFRELDRVRVRGRATPLAVYEPIAATRSLSPERRSELEHWHAFLESYRRCDWTAARAQLFGLMRTTDRPFYRLFIDRIRHFEQHPPAPDWDGVFIHKTK